VGQGGVAPRARRFHVCAKGISPDRDPSAAGQKAGAGRQEERDMAIRVGDRLPEAKFKVRTDDGLEDLTTGQVFAGKKVVLFAVPGAFTPTCHTRHLPSFLEHAEELKAKGVETIACVAVNDAFVLDQWAKVNDVQGRVLMLSDGNGSFTKAIGMELDASGAGLGVRSLRYSMLVEDGVVKILNVEESPGVMEVTGADKLLAAL
jgi:peroxiredoxin